jgi:polyhydroxybutyrate depolymerase
VSAVRWALVVAALAADSSAPLGRDVIRSVTLDGKPRVYHLHVPPRAVAKRLPAVINIHGLGSNALEQEALSRMNALADREGFYVLAPEGLGTGQSFNAGMCCGEALVNKVDDVGYIRAMLDDASKDFALDSRRVFATGMSNGGFMAHRLACELSDRIAAVAPVAGVLGLTECHPKRPVSVLQFHGTMDPLVQYGGGGPLATFPSVESVIKGWAARDGCGSDREPVEKAGDVTCERFVGCPKGVDVELCRIDGGGHTWPGAIPIPRYGKTTDSISATETMWRFFKAHPMAHP